MYIERERELNVGKAAPDRDSVLGKLQKIKPLGLYFVDTQPMVAIDS